MFLTRPPSHRKDSRFDKGGSAHQSTESNFHFTALQLNSYFPPSYDQVCSRKMLLITAKVVFLRTEQNNNSNY